MDTSDEEDLALLLLAEAEEVHMGNSMNYWTFLKTLFLLYLKFRSIFLVKIHIEVVNAKGSPTQQKNFGPKCLLYKRICTIKNIRYMGLHTVF